VAILSTQGEEGFMQSSQEQLVAEEIWLKYFNEYLFQRQLISETQRNKMITLINRRTYESQKGMN